MRCLLVLLFTLICFCQSVLSSHVSGVSVSYAYVKDSVFEVAYHVYRSCNGVAFSNPGSSAKIRCISSGDSASISLTLKSITNVSSVCKSAKNPCSPVNTAYTGEGLEEHIYMGRVDFTTSKYKGLYSCGQLIVEFAQCCRPGYISGIPPAIYVFADFNPSKKLKNSSPIFKQSPPNILCCNTPTRLNFEAWDPDGDSLSYRLAAPLQAWNSNIPYKGYYSVHKPISVYDPNGTGVIDPNTNPPKGFYLDVRNGQLVFTPTGCSESAPIVVVVDEWRKDSAGTYTKIGSIRKDLFLIITSCKSNNIPSISALTSYYVCETDSLSFEIKTDDKVVIPPPPAKVPADDSVFISWNGGISSASFKAVSDTALHATGRFEWRVPNGLYSKEPYTFLVFAKDNNCPYPASNYKVFKIYVTENLARMKPVERIACGIYNLQTDYDSNAALPKLTWTLLDSNGNVVKDTMIAAFKSSRTHTSDKSSDTISIFKSGTFYMQLKAATDSCSSTVLDTIVTNGIFDLYSQPDTQFCYGSNLILGLDTDVSDRISKYRWEYVGTSQTGKTYSGQATKGFSLMKLSAESHDGCEHHDSIYIQTIYKPLVKEISDTVFCVPKQISLTAIDLSDSGLVENTFKWSFGDTTSQISQYFESGKYWVQIQNQCGTTSDSFNIQADSVFKPDLISDRILCDKDSFKLGDDIPKVGVAYAWNSGDTTSFLIAKNSGKYIMNATNTCGSFYDSTILKFNLSPKINLPDTTLYCDKILDTIDAGNAGSVYLWQDGSTEQTHIVNQEQWYNVTVTADGCSTEDSMFADLLLTPVIDLGNDTVLAKPFELILDGGQSDASYLWSTGETTQSISVTDYGNYWVEHSNACGTIRDSISVSWKIGMERFDESIWIIRPNPSTGQFIISSSLMVQPQITIYNELGQRINFQMNRVDDAWKVEMTFTKPGVYHLFIQDNSHQMVRKIVVY